MSDYEKFQLQRMIDHGHSLRELMEELQNAGIDRLKQALQDQIDAWLRNT